MKIRTLIVDDEAPARARISQLLKGENDFEIIGECANGRQAVAAIQKQRPDLVFLDVQMPRLGGFDVCAAVGGEAMPLVIFVTAYNHYALQAFEVHAIDYLLKPFDRERFQKSLRHAREQWRRGENGLSGQRLAGLLESLKPEARKPDRLAFKSNGRVLFVRIEEIDWIEADGNYVRLRVGTASHQLRETIGGLESQLPADRFMRISRSVIVNLDRVKEVQPMFYGDCVVILQDGSRLNLTRTFRGRLEQLLERRS
jgi:two-component system LytT family response regulator